MVHYSRELIEQTIALFEKRTGRALSAEDARQALENITAFFQVLREWSDAEDRPDAPDQPVTAKGLAR